MSDLLQRLRARLREKSEALDTLQTKAFPEKGDGSAEDIKAYEDAITELEDLERKVAMEERAVEVRAKASRPADAPTGGDDPTRTTIVVKPEKEYDLVEKMGLAWAGVFKAGKDGDPIAVLKAEGYEGYLNQLLAETNQQRLAKGEKAVNTLVSSEGGILVPTPPLGGLIELLRARSTFLDAGPTRVTLTNGAFKQPRGATGATAAYVAQGGLKPVSTPTFDAIDMAAKKLAGIVLLTNEARKWTVGAIEAYIREDLRNALALTFDLNAYLGTGAGASPLGILNKVGVQTVTPTFAGATAPTLVELDAFATAMILKLTTSNIFNSGRWRWLMPYRSAMKLADIRDGNGNKAFPTMDGMTPVWKGIPVVVTSQIPINGGGTTDETTIALVDWAHVLYGEEEGIRFATSDQATIDTDGAGTLVHLFQQNMSAILAESSHDIGLRFVKAVVKATVRW